MTCVLLVASTMHRSIAHATASTRPRARDWTSLQHDHFGAPGINGVLPVCTWAPCMQAPPRCTAVTHVKSDIGRPAVTSSESNRIYDLSLQPRWEEDPGGRWVAAASSLGNLILWDTTTWKEMFCAKATNGSMYSCNAMPGCAAPLRRCIVVQNVALTVEHGHRRDCITHDQLPRRTWW